MRLISDVEWCDRSSHLTLSNRHIFETNYMVCLVAIAIDLSGNYFIHDQK
ncbi:MAG: hypothetical protein V7K40_10315 [Nostoc sp.]